MKTMNRIWISALLLSAAAIGCQRQSNPVRSYTVAQDQGVKYVPGNKGSQPTQPDNRQFVCRAPLNVTVIGDVGDRLLKFVENRESTYQIKIGNTLDKSNGHFDVISSNPDVKLNPISRASNLVTYELSWKPGFVKSGDGVDNYLVTLSLKNGGNTICGTDVSTGLNFQVVRTAENPTITFPDLPVTPINHGDKIEFKIVVHDPASVRDQAPNLKDLSFPSALRNGERPILSAVPGLSCREIGQSLGQSNFQFDCAFDSSRVAIGSVRDRTLETIEAKFAAEAVSKRSRKPSGPVTAGISIKLPKNDSVPDPTFGPAASKDEEAKPAPVSPKKKTAAKAQASAKAKGAKS